MIHGVMLSLKTRQWTKMYTFYTALLGEPTRVSPASWAYFKVGSVQLVLWHDREEKGPCGSGSLEITLLTHDLDGARTGLPEGCRPSAVHRASHGRECFFHDPENNRLILYEPGP